MRGREDGNENLMAMGNQLAVVASRRFFMDFLVAELQRF